MRAGAVGWAGVATDGYNGRRRERRGSVRVMIVMPALQSVMFWLHSLANRPRNPPIPRISPIPLFLRPRPLDTIPL